jgi:hypothetical protein
MICVTTSATIAYVAFVPIPTPTHGHAVLGLLILSICLPLLMWVAGAIARLRGRSPVEFIEGVCGRCGYSLRGLPGTTCPECGADTSMVGTRRALGSLARGTWLACAMWVGLLLAINSVWKFEIDGYVLRLFWHVEEYGRWMPMEHPTSAFRQASILVLMVVGVLAIVWISRRKAWQRKRILQLFASN